MVQQLNSNKNKYRIMIAGGAFVCFAFIAYIIINYNINSFDTTVRLWVYGLRTPLTKAIFIPCTYIGNWQTLVSFALLLIIIPKTRKNIGIPMAITALASTGLYSVMKMLFHRPRPDVALHLINQGGYSFPSGHSMNGLVFFGILIYLIRRNCRNKKTANVLTIILLVLTFAIGFSRVFVGVHYPTDILGGWSLGLAVVMLAMIVIDKLEEKNVLQFNN